MKDYLQKTLAHLRSYRTKDQLRMKRHARVFDMQARSKQRIDRDNEGGFLWKVATISLFMLFTSTILPQFAVANLEEPIAYSDSVYNPREEFAFNDYGYILKPEKWSEVGDRSDVAGVIDYVVEEGDTLAEIAGRFAVTEQTLTMNNNWITSDDLEVGDVIKVPSADGVLYTAAAGDSLSQIAQRYDITIEELRSQNQLQPTDTLAIGDTLVIPGAIIEKPKPVVVAAAAPVPVAYNPATTSSPTSAIAAAAPVAAPVAQQPVTIPAPPAETTWGTETGGTLLYPTNRSTSVVTQGYGYGHYALDIAKRGGHDVWAADGGTVIKASGNGAYNGGYGNHIIIDHGNGLQTLYAHFQTIYVTEGQYVARGQSIGYMGTTGRSTGVHLHFEVRKGAQKLNPWNYL